LSSFFTSGDVVVLGEPVVIGLASWIGLAVLMGDGLVAGFALLTPVSPLQAPRTAVETAKTEVNISLLILFLI